MRGMLFIGHLMGLRHRIRLFLQTQQYGD